MVVGPPISEVPDISSLPTSMKLWKQAAIDRDGSLLEQLRRANVSSGWVDVRDVALAHVKALQKEAAGGERIIVCGGGYDMQDWCMYFISLGR
jgi:hypothetical protein